MTALVIDLVKNRHGGDFMPVEIKKEPMLKLLQNNIGSPKMKQTSKNKLYSKKG